MAFRILDEDQIGLLTDEQKAIYEGELEMYNARVAFLDSIEVLENAEIPAYKPRLWHVAVMKEIPKKEFVNPEETGGIQPKVPKPAELQVARRSFRAIKREKTEPSLPNVPRIDSVKLPEVLASVSASLPEVEPVGTVSLPEMLPIGAVSLPEVPAIATVNLPEISTAVTASLPEMSAIGAVSLPDVPAPVTAGLPEVPAIAAVNLPEISTAATASLPEVPAIGAVSLPEISPIIPIRAVFARPERSSRKLPEIESPMVNTKVRIDMAPTVSGLPYVERLGDFKKVFEVPAFNGQEMPQRMLLSIPNADELIRKLFPDENISLSLEEASA